MNLSLFEGDELAALAQLDLDEKRFDSALAKLKQAYELPDYPAVVDSMLARIYAHLRLFDRASFHYEAFLAREPSASLERFQYGMVHFDQDMKERALSVWHEVLDDLPTYPPALFYSALANADLGHEQECLRLIDTLLKSAPADNLYFERGKGLLQQLQARRENANSDDSNVQQLYN